MFQIVTQVVPENSISRHHVTFLNILGLYGELLLAFRPILKLEDHPLSALRDCRIQYICSNPPYPEAVFSDPQS
jgi:hypothetical protein